MWLHRLFTYRMYTEIEFFAIFLESRLQSAQYEKANNILGMGQGVL